MKKLLAFCLLLALACTSFSGLAQAVELKIVTPFAGADAATQEYYDLLTSWEEQTGNMTKDFSSLSNETWKADVLRDTQDGVYDVIVYYVAGADSAPLLSSVVPLREVLTAYPDLQLTINPLMTESDGEIYAIPSRPIWEGLLCNTDLFEQHNLELPTTWDLLVKAIETFKAAGVVPISIPLAEIPHYIVEIAILASGSAADHSARPTTADEIPESWIRGMELIRELYQMGAFPEHTAEMTEDDANDMFMAKQSAMQIDGVWLANSIPAENWNTTAVIPFPTYSAEADPNAIIGGITMGFYITRSAWDDPERRGAAVSLLAYLTSPEASGRMNASFEGRLLESAEQMVGNASSINAPIGDNMNLDVRQYWFDNILPIARGEADPRQVLTEVVNQGGFTRLETAE